MTAIPLVLALALLLIWLARCRHDDHRVRMPDGRLYFVCQSCGRSKRIHVASRYDAQPGGRYDEQKAVSAKLRADIETDQRRLLAAKRCQPEPKAAKKKNVAPFKVIAK